MADTVQGTLFANYFIRYIEKSDWDILFSFQALTRLIDLGTVLNDVVEIIFAVEGMFYHGDFFNFGILTGKFSKLYLQYKLLMNIYK